MSKTISSLTKIDDDRWRINDIVCECGGALYIDRCGHRHFKYETFCWNCRTCDPNGWPTLAKCVEHAEAYFGEKR